MTNKKKFNNIETRPMPIQFPPPLQQGVNSRKLFYLHHWQNKLERLSPKITLLKMLSVLTQVEHQKH